MIKIKAFGKYPSKLRYNYPLGHVNRDHVCIGSITLDRNGADGGRVSQEKAMEILSEALTAGALVTVKFINDEVEIKLSEA